MKILFIIILFLLLAFYGTQIYILFKSRSKHEVSEVFELYLDGHDQSVLLEGRSKDLPILIVLHGGPGSAFPFGMGSRGIYPELTENFITVYWDQYGSGRNYKKLDKDFDVNEFNKMLEDLVAQMRVRFPENEVYLFGVSWGSILALNAAVSIEDKLDGVITYGQFISGKTSADYAVEKLETNALKEEHKQLLESLKGKYDYKTIDKLQNLMSKYTNGMMYKEKDASNSHMYSLLFRTMMSPDYNLYHFIKSQTGFNNIKDNTDILSEISTIDLTDQLKEVKIPYTIIQGKYDLVTSTRLVHEKLDEINNKNISVMEVDKSGHFPSREDFNELLSLISKQIKK